MAVVQARGASWVRVLHFLLLGLPVSKRTQTGVSTVLSGAMPLSQSPFAFFSLVSIMKVKGDWGSMDPKV